ncbi:hypothetical protein [Paenibacillus sp. FJAT-27812]|uniref:hypothetical protein n=1 Tax=Paenibacillus sp. FJAT-27812 TaxID=1684143 RepID=UPI0006A7E728
MPSAGDRYRVTIKEAHLNWGTHRYTNTRPRRGNESYIQIPAAHAYSIGIRAGSTYNCVSVEGTLNTTLLASGQQSDPLYAKQFESMGDLTILGNWLHNVCRASVGDKIDVYWITPTDMELTFIRQ